MKITFDGSELPDRSMKKWGKHLTGVDAETNSGYAFEGDWVNTNGRNELPVGEYVLWYYESGKSERPQANVILYQAKPEGLVELHRWKGIPKKSWAARIKSDVARIFSDGSIDEGSAVAELQEQLCRHVSREVAGTLISTYRRLVGHSKPGILGAREVLMDILELGVSPFSDYSMGDYERMLMKTEVEMKEEEE